MLLLLLFAAGAGPAPPARPQRAAKVVVRVVTPARATGTEWLEGKDGTRREILVEEDDGRRTRVRVIEHE